MPEAWRVTDEADLRWILARLAPTPFGHFKDPVRRKNPTAEALPPELVELLLEAAASEAVP